MQALSEKKLSYQHRQHLPKGEFAIPAKAPKSGSYPIDTKNRARNALARVSQNGSSSEKAKVRAAVHSKYPNIGECQVPPLGAAEWAELNEGTEIIGQAKPGSRKERGQPPYYYWEYDGQQFPRKSMAGGSGKGGGYTVDFQTGEVRRSQHVGNE